MLIHRWLCHCEKTGIALFELQRTLVNVLGVMRFTVLCNVLYIAIINEKAGSIRQLFVNTACFFLYYAHRIPVLPFLADDLK